MRPDVFALAAALGAVFFFANADDSVSSTNNLVSKEDQNAKTSPRDDCKQKFTVGCIQSDITAFFRSFAKAPPLEIFPGVTISSNINKRLFNSSSPFGISDFLKTITLHVAVYNDEALSYIYAHNQPQDGPAGRGKKFKFLSIYTVFAIAFALLSALVGKAMTLSIVSLVMAMLTRNLIGNAPAGSPPIAYDIVRRPQVQLAHTQTQEDIYEGAHSYPVGYVFPRVTARSSHPYYAQVPRIPPAETPIGNVEMPPPIE
ncbi:Hypothetical protein NTJ_09464 [Nesidiocoris tenuis]|uniref:SEA domain-containing protein n=1 Tax=Nesidiocoris tenuis TaxID=355587 RepID=A0ABN7AWT7_9HEMI|nr:Hypothetical protein NTJ_09464 [Nesidiocoris tenuis]